MGLTRSEIMSRIRSRNTGPERRLKSLLREAAISYRSQRKAGRHTADVVIHGLRIAVFVHGCWWHQHEKHAFRDPCLNTDKWREKFRKNKARDRRAVRSANHAGWSVVTLWECETDTAWLRKVWRAIAKETVA